jgi:hypothetical protein
MKQRQARVRQSVWIAFATIGIILGGRQAAAAQEQKIDVNGIVRDTQQVSNEGGEFNIAWWLPDEFWKASLAAKPGATTPAQQETLIKVVHPYFIIGIISGKSGAFGAMTYRTEADVRAMVQLKDSEGNIYKPLADDKVDGSVPALLGLMKPGMARMMGPMGENINFYIFEGTNKDGARKYDPLKDGAVEMDLGDRVFKWRLPLDSVVPKQKCPTCGETLSGAYKFCPYDGTKLAGNR